MTVHPALPLLLVALTACPKGRERTEDRLSPLLFASDKAWEARGSEGLEAVESLLVQAYAIDRDSPAVAWRLTRLEIAQAMLLDDRRERVERLAAARAQSWECVLADPKVRALEVELGLEDALGAVPQSRLACLDWAAHAWTRWMGEFGPHAAALDVERIETVLGHLDTRTTDPWLLSWTGALLRTLRPGDEDSHIAGDRALQEVARRQPSRLEPLVHRYRYGVTGDTVRPELVEAKPDTPEERAMVRRALAN